MANIPVLPKGYFAGDWDDYSGWINHDAEISDKKPLTKQCTCGTSITMGYDVPAELHQQYCDLVRKDSDNS